MWLMIICATLLNGDCDGQSIGMGIVTEAQCRMVMQARPGGVRAWCVAPDGALTRG
jgi:hypothetical protein